MTTAYSVDLRQGVISHGGHVALALDGSELNQDALHRRMFIGSLIRSGDYFITLATKLDGLSKEAASNEALSDELQRLVSDLMYLQYSYEIQKKPGVKL